MTREGEERRLIVNRQREKGSALLVVVIFALVLGLTCAAMVVASAANAMSSKEALNRVRALTVAEIGVEFTKGKIIARDFNGQFAAHDHQAAFSDSVYAPDGSLYGQYSMVVTEYYGGVTGQYLVVCRGVCGQTARQVEEVIKRTPPEMPNTLGAINLYNPNSLANFSGQPPYVCGLDTNIPNGIDFSNLKASDCTPGSGEGPDAVGIAVHDNASVSQIVSALGSRTSNIVGTDGSGGSSSPSVYNVTTTNPTGQVDTATANEVVTMAQNFGDLAQYVYDNGNWFDSSGKPVSGDFGSTNTPRVVAIRNTSGGTLHMNGNISGVGVLVIDCNVQFGGTFNYAGLVVITSTGSATVDVDMRGTPLVMGSMIAANPGMQSTSVLDLRGTADVFYSNQSLAYAQMALMNRAKFVRKYYAEKKPNDTALALN